MRKLELCSLCYLSVLLSFLPFFGIFRKHGKGDSPSIVILRFPYVWGSRIPSSSLCDSFCVSFGPCLCVRCFLVRLPPCQLTSLLVWLSATLPVPLLTAPTVSVPLLASLLIPFLVLTSCLLSLLSYLCFSYAVPLPATIYVCLLFPLVSCLLPFLSLSPRFSSFSSLCYSLSPSLPACYPHSHPDSRSFISLLLSLSLPPGPTDSHPFRLPATFSLPGWLSSCFVPSLSQLSDRVPISHHSLHIPFPVNILSCLRRVIFLSISRFVCVAVCLSVCLSVVFVYLCQLFVWSLLVSFLCPDLSVSV